MGQHIKALFQNNTRSDAKSTLHGLGISAKDYPEHGVWLLDYNQIDSPKTDPLVIESRSLIIDYNGNVISKKFDRFFNMGEALEITSKIDVTDSTIYNKEDGSIIGLWYSPKTKTWEISSRGMALGESTVYNSLGDPVTFAELSLKTLGVTREKFQEIMNHYAYMFGYETVVLELCTRLNRVVTPYETDRAYILVITRPTTEEIDLRYGGSGRVEMLTTYFENLSLVESFQSNGMTSDQLKQKVESLPGLREGFVIRDNKTGLRMKVKATQYLVAHRLRGNNGVPSLSDVIELLYTKEHDEFLAYFPEWQELFDNVESRIVQRIGYLSVEYELLQNIESQKDFAIAVNSNIDVKSNSSLFFMARKAGIKGCNDFCIWVTTTGGSARVYESLYEAGKYLTEQEIEKEIENA